MSDEQQTQQADDPSGPGWRDVEVGEILQSSDMLSDGTRFVHTDAAGSRCTWQGVYRRRIEQQAEPEPQPERQPEPQPEPQLTPDDPSGPGWRGCCQRYVSDLSAAFQRNFSEGNND